MLKNRLSSFGYLNITQFLGAMNDNVFKLLIVFCFIHSEQGGKPDSSILALTGGIYVIPFLLLSSTAGTLADRYSKTTIMIGTKIAEFLIMILGMIAFGLKSKALSFCSLFLLASHSAIFGPCKYGIVPEIVPLEKISKANGQLTSCTYLAIILGTFLGSFLTSITDRNFVLSAGFCAICSLIGFFASCKIEKTPPSGSQKKINPWFITELIRNLRLIRQEPSLLSAVLGSGYFLMIGSFCQLNMIPFAMECLNLSDIQGGYLFLITALGIGCGSLLAGKLSGKAVELGLVPIGGIGMVVGCFCMDMWAEDLYWIIPTVATLGLFGGIYVVPLDSHIQVTSPKTYRGQILATANFFGFIGVLCSALLLYVTSEVLLLPADKGFDFVGTLTLGITIALSISMSGYIVRFCSLIISKVFFKTTLHGGEEIPLRKPSFFIVGQSYWPWAMVLLALQRRRMRLFTIAQEEKLPWLARLSKRLIPILSASSPSEIAPHTEKGDLIRHAIERGSSIGIFCSKEQLASDSWIHTWMSELTPFETPFFSLEVSGNQVFEGRILPRTGHTPHRLKLLAEVAPLEN